MLGVKGNLFQEGLCHTQVCSTQSLCPCGSPLLTCFSTGDAQTQFCLSLCGVPRSWCSQGLSEPSEHLWWEWGLIINVNSPLLPSCWGSFFALDMGYLLTATGCSSAAVVIAGRNSNNLRYADDITLMAETKEELKSLLKKAKEESGKSCLKAQHSKN